ncbi:MAG: hypothetical protein M9962_12125 [Oligoflexia bacterium]|nr:hypothetical protein [Oligoflexia bacterium]
MRLLTKVLIFFIFVGCSSSSIGNKKEYKNGARDIAAMREIIEGGNHGGGGSAYEVAFISIGRSLVDELQKVNPDKVAGVPLLQLRQVIDESMVDASFDLLYRGSRKNKKRVDALNYPKKKKIVLSIPAWNKLETFEQKENLVLHEYLGLMNLEKDNYDLSQKMLSELRRFSKISPAEKICDPNTLGLHHGDYCLWDLIESAQEDLEKTYKILEFKIDHIKIEKDDDGASAYVKERATKRSREIKKIFPLWTEAECALSTTVKMGNPGAYYFSLCELEATQAQRNRLLRLLNELNEY